jgi:hypothetical protein
MRLQSSVQIPESAASARNAQARGVNRSIEVALGEMLVMRDNDGFPHIALRLLVRWRDFARCLGGGGNDRLDRLADPDSVLVGRVRGYRHDPRRSRRMNFVRHSPK